MKIVIAVHERAKAALAAGNMVIMAYDSGDDGSGGVNIVGNDAETPCGFGA